MSDEFYTQLAVWSQVAGSAAFFVVMLYVWIKFIAPAVRASQQRKNAELVELERKRDAAKAEIERANRELVEVAGDVQAIRARGKTDALAVRERILREATSEGERLVRNAEGELERGRAAGRDALRARLIARALEIARHSAASLDDVTNDRLVGEVVAAVEGPKG